VEKICVCFCLSIKGLSSNVYAIYHSQFLQVQQNRLPNLLQELGQLELDHRESKTCLKLKNVLWQRNVRFRKNEVNVYCSIRKSFARFHELCNDLVVGSCDTVVTSWCVQAAMERLKGR